MDLPSILAAAFSVFITLAELALEYLKVLVWPAAVLTLALIYRRPLVSVLHRLRKASGWGVSVETEARDLAIDSEVVTVLDAAIPDPDVAGSEGSVDSETKQDSQSPLEGDPEAEEPSHDDRGVNLTNFRKSWSSAAQSRFVSKYPHLSTLLIDQALSEEALGQMRRNRIEAAWIALGIVTADAANMLGIDPSGRTLLSTVAALAERNILKFGQVRIAARLSNLYGAIRSDDAWPTEETTRDFTIAASNLKAALRAATEALAQAPDPDTPN